MRLVVYQNDEGPRVAGVRDDGLVDLNRADAGLPPDVKALLAQGPMGLRRAAAALQAGPAMPFESGKMIAPIPSPEKVIGVGLNYVDHAKESGLPVPAEPVVFCKLPTTIRAHGEPIMLPDLSSQVDYEAELVVVIGVGGRHIQPEQVRGHIAGYCCGNDVSARDWQLDKPGGQWFLGKSFDSFAPIGPVLVTADGIPDPNRLAIQLRLNGRVMQESNTSQFIFPVERLVSYVSGVCTLAPGDLIFTGTPPGVGCARKPPVYLKPGDVVEVEIERIGVLRNPVIREEPQGPDAP